MIRLDLLLIGACLPLFSLGQSADFDLQAHRGGLGLVVESTLPAFANALRLGVSTLELDIQITADRVALVTHDRQVQAHKCRDTAPLFPDDPLFPYVGKYVHQLSLAQLRTLDCGAQRLQQYPRQTVFPGQTMPTLGEVLNLLQAFAADEVMLNIETKVEAGAPEETAPREQFVRAVITELRNADLLQRATIQSFDWGALMMVRELEPRLPIIALSNAQAFLQCGQAGASPWLGGIDIDDFDCDLVAAAASFGADAISPVHGLPQNAGIGQDGYEPFVTADMVSRAHGAGMRVIPWTVNDVATIDYLLDLGVDGLITDYPDRLRQVLLARGLRAPAPALPRARCAQQLPLSMDRALCAADAAIIRTE